MVTNNACNTYVTAPTTYEVQYPLQPMFIVGHNSTQNDKTGDGTNYQLRYSLEAVDANGDFNTGTYTYTAPISGVHLIELFLLPSFFLAGHTKEYRYINTSNVTYVTSKMNPYIFIGSVTNNQSGIGGTILCYMDSGDTITTSWQVSGSTKTVYIINSTDINAVRYYRFNGKLMC